MKKILFVAMMAVAFMACGDKNGGDQPDQPRKDQAAVNAVSTDAVELVGQPIADVEKTLLAAGFQKADESVLQGAPKRLLGKFRAPADIPETSVFVYGIDLKYCGKYGIEDVTAFNNALANGSIIITAVEFIDDQVCTLGSEIMVTASGNASRVYTDISDGLYAKIPSDALQSVWKGVIGLKEYTQQNQFVADIAAAQNGVKASETGAVVTAISAEGNESFGYQGIWIDPNAEEQVKMQEKGYTPYAGATIIVY